MSIDFSPEFLFSDLNDIVVGYHHRLQSSKALLILRVGIHNRALNTKEKSLQTSALQLSSMSDTYLKRIRNPNLGRGGFWQLRLLFTSFAVWHCK
jgi:hypothetical protein